jgi:predicted  nucleic acid-binding Zn-ribbon protein
MRRAIALSAFLLVATSAGAQSSIAACGPLPDATSKQAIKVFDELQVCLVATDVVGTEAEVPHEWAARGRNVVLETMRPGDNRRASITGDRVAWTINGQPATVDSMADRWQKAVLDLLDASYEADLLRLQSAELQDEIDSLPVRRDALRKRIETIELKQRQLEQAQLEAQRREASMRSQISNLESRQRDLESRANSDERKAQSTRDERARRSLETSAANYRSQALRIDEQIRGLQQHQQAMDETKRMVLITEELRALDPDNSIALLKIKLTNLDSTRVEDLRAELTQLDAPRRLPDLESRVETARRSLLAVLEARGKAPSR